MRPWRQWATFGLVLFVAAGSGFLLNAASPEGIAVFQGSGGRRDPKRSERVSAQELGRLKREGKAVILLDVRNPEAWKEGHPAEAIHLPSSDPVGGYARQRLGSLLRVADLVVVLCDSERCGAGEYVAGVLRALGHDRVFVLEGGWEKYSAAGLPVVRP